MYTVKYRLPGHWFFRTLKRVKGDDMAPNGARCFLLEDETRIEIPKTALFVFDPSRFLEIKKNMEREAGQKIEVG